MHLTTLSRTFRSDDSSKTFSRPYSNSDYSCMQIAFFLGQQAVEKVSTWLTVNNLSTSKTILNFRPHYLSTLMK